LSVIGTATTLLSYGGITILTDPNFLHRGQKAYLGKGMWSTQSYEITKSGARLRVTSAPGRHAQGLLQAALPQVMGSVLEFSAPGEPDLSVYVTGGTLLIEDLRELPRRHPHLDLGLWHLGGTRIPFGRGMLVTMDASMGADLLELVHPDRTVPIHNDDYGVFTSPRGAFLAEVDRRGLTGVRAVDRGETVPLPLP